ncbi:lung seven transmembrane receptor-domain-containing protein, partial [Endogone sp. FLAS-F59071]
MAPSPLKPLAALLLLACLSILATAETTWLSSDSSYPLACAGMYAKSDIPTPGTDAWIRVQFSDLSNGHIAMVIYEHQDLQYIGATYSDDELIEDNEPKYICDTSAIASNICTNSSLGSFLFSLPPSLPLNATSIYTKTFQFVYTSNGVVTAEQGASYQVSRTGYYCVVILTTRTKDPGAPFFEADIDWQNSYGELPAIEYPKIWFYGLFSILYLVIGVLWMIQSLRYWRDILTVQNYISGVIFFLMVEMAFNWAYWQNYNINGKPSWGLLAMVVITNAGRNSISFFMLLIVCMGYGVVKPSLGSTMQRCAALAYTHFAFGVIYSSGTMLMDPDDAGIIIVLVIFPLALTMTLFYVWILQSINQTLTVLDLRRQTVKAIMYRRLYRLLVFSVGMVILFFFLNAFNFSYRNTPGWAARNWKWRWFMLDGWLNVLYFIVFFVIVVLWRPTENNRRYGLDQLSQDEDEAMDLENRLRAAEGLGFEGMKNRTNGAGGALGDDAIIFELGGDELSDEEDGKGGAYRERGRSAGGVGMSGAKAVLQVESIDVEAAEEQYVFGP